MATILLQFSPYQLLLNLLSNVDLKPLANVQSLIEFSIGGNPIEELDISPVFNAPTLRSIKLDYTFDITYEYPLRFLREEGLWSPIKKIIFPSPPASNHNPELQIFCNLDTKIEYEPKYFQVTVIPNVHKVFTI